MNNLDDAEKDAIILSLAITALVRPGWNHYLSGIAEKFGPLSMFEDFKRHNADQYKPPKITDVEAKQVGNVMIPTGIADALEGLKNFNAALRKAGMETLDGKKP